MAYAERHKHSRSSEEVHGQPQKRQSPPPPVRTSTDGLIAASRLGHRRRDSDTLRSGAVPSGSPTVGERSGLPPRLSPNPRGQPLRRSPTAPEASALSNMASQQQQRERESTRGEGSNPKGAHREAPPPPAPTSASQSNKHIMVNRQIYARLDMIGKGGSSRVYRAMANNNEIYAIKRVTLDKTDADTLQGYKNEIGLLKRLAGNQRIIRLIDSEVKSGPNGRQGHLFLVMEYGEIDLARLLAEQQKEPMNMAWIAYYWQQMLQAVQIVHDEKIVHSDLKPANFVLVKGQLKLIDFGIANAIANDTTNIQRDHQIGTLNYMSPEAIELPEGTRRLKVGRASDVWSLGCILYQMVYGRPPFQHLSTMYHKMKAIPDASYEIEYPEYAVPSVPKEKKPEGGENGGEGEESQRPKTPTVPLEHLKRRVRSDVIQTMKSCLMRNPKQRAVIPDLLQDDWLVMTKDPEPQKQPNAIDLLADDETIISPHYMAQLLQHGMRIGADGGMDEEALGREAQRLVMELRALYATSH
ncbi:Pkinase-domain-containing protein [Schizophyllum commune H4-8]|uniref:Pkinase-domain-containing protein n=1 Tax=Schizophyllum commune (strain H4-8 / FGSC 9210) TaxID=578458 RepID=UPI002160A69F|nr:Pkinase-domain-containing protein [Schizophyllum commune H4-8]KAI5896541.1 Pkinase-domain-containing protein [Schizophyllum commune H4-8]